MGTSGNKHEPGFARIEPAKVELTAAPSARRPEPGRGHSARQTGIWIVLAILLVAATGVFFVLPRWVGSPDIDHLATQGEAQRQSAAAPPAPAAAPGSPWEQAQESQLRRDSQAILEQMLEAQKLLAQQGVSVWAPEEYQHAIQLAKSGDERYNKRDFAGAREQYEQGLAVLQNLQQRVDQVFEDALAHGKQALADGDSEAAQTAFSLALAIDPLDRAALEGRERAENLDAVLGLLREGDRLLDNGQLEAAGDAYRKALARDAQSERARQQIAVVEQRLKKRRFNERMSAGFAAIDAGEGKRAKQAFAAALRLEPGSPEAAAGLEQSEHALKARSIANLLDEARVLEAQERWHDALTKYTAVLELDPALAAAQAGRDRSALRAQIHDRLNQLLANPQRLYDADVLEDAEAFHRRVSALREPGPQLASQVGKLGDLLHKMRVPVTVKLQSDNLTRVTLYKIGELGRFTTREVRLRPGRYIAVGVREGYRDTRVEFTVDPDQPVPAVQVSAEEKIAFGGGT